MTLFFDNCNPEGVNGEATNQRGLVKVQQGKGFPKFDPWNVQEPYPGQLDDHVGWAIVY